MELIHRTDIGKKRAINEDYLDVVEKEPGMILAVLADGMGGHNAGDVASELAVRFLVDRFQKSTLQLTSDATTVSSWLKEAYEGANERISTIAESDPSCKGMGTTLIAAVFQNNKVTFAHIGDSRVYLYSKGEINPLTKDHSYVNVLLDSGEISEEQARTHPRKNMLMKAIGTEISIDPDILTVSLRAEEYMLICSDGLSNMVSAEQMVHVLQSEATLHAKVETLIELANEQGGEDNISLIISRVRAGE
ncbi:protein phosphatase [Chryseomicrobium excrementi]|uniref:protein-serine/threonine phosphatase n=1 Tax=Chryseomicrobium excrementi TaxID=2041346 RepID=A0A2M9F3B0_9BACL|nr:Stp1/IreP family PP2C-type Ser/Thr phosphatase [Chryseomicrobium excrementi]PJK17915.1 protein phosphatase [Chryseomicrobium excrementi]